MKLPAIDVLRGIAALGVAWFHSRVDLWVGFREIQADPATYSRLDWLLSFFSLPVSQMGGLVMLFFVLSGFCIHLPVASKNLTPSWSSYAVRRLLRIYPAYMVAISLCFFVTIFLLKGVNGSSAELGLYAATAAMLQNWIYAGNQIGMNPSLWSIPIEVEFYLVYPLLLLLWRKQGTKSALFFTLVCTFIGIAMFHFGYAQATFTFFKYALIWNSGAWLAEAYANNRLPKWSSWHSILIIATLTVTMLAGLAGVDHFYLHYGWALFSFLLVFWVLGPGAHFFQTPRWWMSALVFAGTVSYSIYLLHFPLFKLAGSFWIQTFGTKPQSFLLPTIATLCVIPFAWIFYRLIELPTHQIGRQWGSALQDHRSSNP